MKSKLLLLVTILFFSIDGFSQVGSACWREVSAGQNFTLAIKSDGTLWGWGQNSNLLGLGLGNLANQNLPIQIGTANDWLTVSAGTIHSLAVKTNGTLWSWGNGQFGQLGNGVFNSATPNVTQVGTATDWLRVSAGNRFSLAIKNTGTLWSWGWNFTGQLGNNTVVDLNLPAQVGTANDWFLIDAGDQHALAIKTTGTLWAWGNNTFGQLGDGTNTTSLLPIQIGTATNWSLISGGTDHSMALDSSNILYTFGNNTNGQLGDGTNTPSNVPIPISFSSSGLVSFYIAISAGQTHSLAIKNDNTLWSAGFNNQGQLGLGNLTNTNVLTQIGTANTWIAISAGHTHSHAVDSNTDIWSAGRGLEGELGIGSNTAFNTLQVVGCPTATLSTNEIKLLKATVYPNPTNGTVNISYNLENDSKITLRLTSIQGQIIQETILDKSSGPQTDSYDLSSVSNGMYFISVSNANGTYTIKVIKE
jgi:alpha-tubulin suppressor-like RCC1 family protein